MTLVLGGIFLALLATVYVIGVAWNAYQRVTE